MKKIVLIHLVILMSIYCNGQWIEVDNQAISIGQMAIRDSIIFGSTSILSKIKAIVISTDQGKSWSKIGDFTGLLALSDSNIYVLSEKSGYEIYSTNIYKINWTRSNCAGIGAENGEGWGITSFLAKGNTLFVGNNNGSIYKSDDKGLNWHNSSAGLITGYTSFCGQTGEIYCLKTNGINIYTGTHCYGIYVSKNNGDSWEPLNTGIPSRTSAYQIACAKSKLFVASNNGLYYSIDSGSNWLYEPRVGADGLDALDSNIIVSSGRYIYLSKNNGRDWFSFNYKLLDTSLNNYNWLFSDSNSFYLPGPAEVFKINIPDTSLMILNYGLTRSYPTTILNKSKFMFVATRGGGINTSYDNGTTWNAYSNSLTGIVVNALVEANNAYFAGTSIGLYASSDSCKSWQLQLPISHIRCLVNFQESIYIGTDIGVYKYNLSSSSLTVINNGLNDSIINTLVTVDSTLYLGSGNGMYYFDNNTDAWKLIAGTNNITVNSITNDNCDIYYSSDYSIYKLNCTNYALEDFNFNLPEAKINSLLVSDSHLIAATDTGVYFFDKIQKGWYSNGMDEQIYCLSDDSDFVYAGGSQGILKLSIHKIPTSIPKLPQKNISLYPNPCVNVINLDLKSIQNKKIQITVYDNYGQIISSHLFVNTNDIVSINCSSYVAGVYFIQIYSDNVLYTTKFIKE